MLTSGRQPTWSPDGRRLAFVRDGDVYTIRADGRGERRVTRTARAEAQPSWSRDGRDARTVALILAHPSRAVWSPDGSALVFGADTGEVYAARASGRAEAFRLVAGLEPDWR